MDKKNLGCALAALVTASCALAAVPQPWTPVEAADGIVRVWGREYAFTSNALPVSLKTQGHELLAGPIRVICADKTGEEAIWRRGGSWVQEQDGASATVCAWQEATNVTADVTARVEYDGMAKITLSLVPGNKSNSATLSKAWVEIPIVPSFATLWTTPGSFGSTNSAGAVNGPMAWPFRYYVWLGNEKAGLCWFCETSRNLHPAEANRAIEVLPGDKETILRIRITDTPLLLPSTITFGLQVTPVKPWLADWSETRSAHAVVAGVGANSLSEWGSSRRAFPDGRVGEALDALKAAGVRTIMFHEDWIPIQNNPSPRADFKRLVEACHKRGLKVYTYLGFELSPLDPIWGDYYEDALELTSTGRPLSWWYRLPGQRDYRVCYQSRFADKWLERAFKAYDDLGLDGYYLDTTADPRPCANERHGCGWTDKDGKRHCTHPIFAVRETMRRLCDFVHSRGGRVLSHQSGCTCAAVSSFADAIYDGEHLTEMRKNFSAIHNADSFRAEYLGRNLGLPCEFLTTDRWPMEEVLALTLVHDALPHARFSSVPKIAPVWKALDDFGYAQAEWIPYWDKPVAVTPSTVKASLYRKGGESMIVVSNLSPDTPASAEVTLPPDAKRAEDMLAKRTLEVVGGKVRLELQPFRFVMLRATP